MKICGHMLFDKDYPTCPYCDIDRLREELEQVKDKLTEARKVILSEHDRFVTERTRAEKAERAIKWASEKMVELYGLPPRGMRYTPDEIIHRANEGK